MIKLILTTDDPMTIMETKDFLKSLIPNIDHETGHKWTEYEHIIIPRIATRNNNCFDADKRKNMYLVILDGEKFSINKIKDFDKKHNKILIN